MILRRAGRLAGVLGVLAVLVAPALPGSTGHRALGHAQLVTSSPGAGEVVAAPPPELRLVFSEPLEAEITSLDVRDAEDELVVERAGAPDPADPFALVAELPALPDGVYSVTWRTLSAADGHTVEGFFSFGIGDVTLTAADAGGSTHGETDVLDIGARFATYAAIVGAIGLTTFAAFVMRESPLPRRLIRSVAVILAAAGVVTLVTAVANALAAGDAAGYLLESRTGAIQLARAALAIVVSGVLLVLPARAALVVAVTAGLATSALLVVGGHASALPGPVPILAGVVHVMGAAVWIGGVVGLAVLALRPTLMVDTHPPGLRTIVPRFSALALASIGLVGMTGIAAAWWHTGTLIDPGTDYGRALIVKTALAAGALVLGGLNFLDGGSAALRTLGIVRRIRIESAFGIGVLVATAVLATSSPNDGSAGVKIRPVPNALGEVTPGMTLTLSPGRPGVNRAVVETTDALAMSDLRLELVLDRLETGTTTRVQLHHAGVDGTHGMESMEGMPGHGTDDPAAAPASTSGSVAWIADAVVLAAASGWDANVLTISSTGAELDRQRFAFEVTDDGIGEGRVDSAITPATIAGAILLVGGAVAIGLALGGASLPRCDPRTSAVALRAGGATALVLGVSIGADALLRL